MNKMVISKNVTRGFITVPFLKPNWINDIFGINFIISKTIVNLKIYIIALQWYSDVLAVKRLLNNQNRKPLKHFYDFSI